MLFRSVHSSRRGSASGPPTSRTRPRTPRSSGRSGQTEWWVCSWARAREPAGSVRYQASRGCAWRAYARRDAGTRGSSRPQEPGSSRTGAPKPAGGVGPNPRREGTSSIRDARERPARQAGALQEMIWRRRPDSNRRVGGNWKIQRTYRRVRTGRRAVWVAPDSPGV